MICSSSYRCIDTACSYILCEEVHRKSYSCFVIKILTWVAIGKVWFGSVLDLTSLDGTEFRPRSLSGASSLIHKKHSLAVGAGVIK